MQSKETKSGLIIGVLIGSVAGVALGAVATNLANRLVGRTVQPVHHDQLSQVDPRWLLQ